MDTIKFNGLSDFVNHVKEVYLDTRICTSDDDFIGVSVVAPYYPMIEILNELVRNSDFTMRSVEIEAYDVCGYDDDFIMQIDVDGDIWVQRTTYESGNIIICEDDIIFVSEEVNSKFLTRNVNKNIVCFEINGEEVDEEYNDSNFALGGILPLDDDTMYGFNASKSDGNSQMWCSFYSSEKLTKDDYKELLREFGFSN